MKQRKAGASKQPQAAVKTVFKVCVGTDGIQTPKKWQGQPNGQDGDHRNHQVTHRIHPILSIGLGWHPSEGEGTEHGSEDAATSCPPWNTPACLKEIFATTVAAMEPNADANHGGEVPTQDEVMQPAKGCSLVCDPSLANGRGAYSRADLSAGKDDILSPDHSGGGDLGFRQRASRGPAIGDGMVGQGLPRETGMILFELVALIKEAAVGATQNEQVALSPSHAAACHDASRWALTVSPASLGWLILPHVGEKMDPLLILASATQHVEAFFVAIVLGQGQVEGTGSSGYGLEYPPSKGLIITLLGHVQRPKLIRRCLQGQILLASRQVDGLVDQSCLAMDRGLR